MKFKVVLIQYGGLLSPRACSVVELSAAFSTYEKAANVGKQWLGDSRTDRREYFIYEKEKS